MNPFQKIHKPSSVTLHAIFNELNLLYCRYLIDWFYLCVLFLLPCVDVLLRTACGGSIGWAFASSAGSAGSGPDYTE